MFIEQPPLILRWLYPRAFWRMDKNEKAVYLTFDDGPIPEITPWVLDLLDKYNIKATFFLVGDNVRKHPKEFQMIVERDIVWEIILLTISGDSNTEARTIWPIRTKQTS